MANLYYCLFWFVVAIESLIQPNFGIPVVNSTGNATGFTSRERLSLSICQAQCYKALLKTSHSQAPTDYYKDCEDAYLKGQTNSGVYTVKPDDQEPFQVYCDMVTDGGGWTVFQRREDGSVDFYRNWIDYVRGFGSLSGEHWLGLRKLHRVVSSASHELRVDLEDFAGNTVYARYGDITITGATDRYRLRVSGYTGTAGDSLTSQSGFRFTTKDQDNDEHADNCAKLTKGAWWYNRCHKSNLNALYLRGHSAANIGVNWADWLGFSYSLKGTEMKIRRK